MTTMLTIERAIADNSTPEMLVAASSWNWSASRKEKDATNRLRLEHQASHLNLLAQEIEQHYFDAAFYRTS